MKETLRSYHANWISHVLEASHLLFRCQLVTLMSSIKLFSTVSVIYGAHWFIIRILHGDCIVHSIIEALHG